MLLVVLLLIAEPTSSTNSHTFIAVIALQGVLGIGGLFLFVISFLLLYWWFRKKSKKTAGSQATNNYLKSLSAAYENKNAALDESGDLHVLWKTEAEDSVYL